jgi:hypothetical protein
LKYLGGRAYNDRRTTQIDIRRNSLLRKQGVVILSNYLFIPAVAPNVANIRVLVGDPKAKVWIDGTLTSQGGTDRLYHTPALPEPVLPPAGIILTNLLLFFPNFNCDA